MARIAFKPTSTISRKQNTVSRDGEEVELIARGRHDPCVVPRAVPMVEAMAALVVADQLLQARSLCMPSCTPYLLCKTGCEGTLRPDISSLLLYSWEFAWGVQGTPFFLHLTRTVYFWILHRCCTCISYEAAADWRGSANLGSVGGCAALSSWHLA